MTLQELTSIFNRALARTLNIKKFLALFLLLIFAGLIFLFFQGASLYITSWLKIPFKCIPWFIVIGFLMVGGVLLCKMDFEDLKFEAPLASTWEIIVRASCFTFPLLLAFIIFWVLLGVFILLKTIPVLGVFLGIVLAFAPFLLNLAILLLFVAALGVLFYLSPSLALKQKVDYKPVLRHFKGDVFTHLLLLIIGFIPTWIVWLFAREAIFLTFETYSYGDTPVFMFLQAFFMMLPCLAVLTPALVLFFSLAIETHQFNHKSVKT